MANISDAQKNNKLKNYYMIIAYYELSGYLRQAKEMMFITAEMKSNITCKTLWG